MLTTALIVTCIVAFGGGAIGGSMVGTGLARSDGFMAALGAIIIFAAITSGYWLLPLLT